MEFPSYFLSRPPAASDPETNAAFARLYAVAVAPGSGAAIAYTLAAPKWQFLSYLCDTRGLLLHGSGDPDIGEFEPRQSNDIHEFGNRRAVYAASDGIWPIYFAIVDRPRYVTSLVNGCFRVLHPDGSRGQSYYFFSVNADALPHVPWRAGTIYILPRDTFEPQPRQPYRGLDLDVAQWASPVPVRPLAKLAVGPADFPFLAQIRAHDLGVLRERTARDPEGFPWLDEELPPRQAGGSHRQSI